MHPNEVVLVFRTSAGHLALTATCDRYYDEACDLSSAHAYALAAQVCRQRDALSLHSLPKSEAA